MEIKINSFNIQHGKLGRPFQLVGTEIDKTQPPKWIGKNKKSCWIHIFSYKDEKGGQFKMLENYNGKFIKL